MIRIPFRFISGLLILIAIVAIPAASTAQTGPQVPCSGCPDLEFVPKPETGLWNNPLDPTGTGFMLEVQGERLAGFLFIYDETGEPVWFLLAGTLEPGPEGGDALWVVETELTRFAAGPCINCPSQPAMVSGSGGTVRLEFLARNFGRFRIDDGPWENLVPLTFGVVTEAVFPDVTDYRLPDLEGAWIFHFPATGFDLSSPSRRLVLPIKLVSVACDGDGRKCYEIRRDYNTVSLAQFSPPPHPFEFGQMVCVGGPNDGPFCRLEFENSFSDLIDAPFIIPLANLGDSRFVGAQAGGRTLRVDAFRVDHD